MVVISFNIIPKIIRYTNKYLLFFFFNLAKVLKTNFQCVGVKLLYDIICFEMMSVAFPGIFTFEPDTYYVIPKINVMPFLIVGSFGDCMWLSRVLKERQDGM